MHPASRGAPALPRQDRKSRAVTVVVPTPPAVPATTTRRTVTVVHRRSGAQALRELTADGASPAGPHGAVASVHHTDPVSGRRPTSSFDLVGVRDPPGDQGDDGHVVGVHQLDRAAVEQHSGERAGRPRRRRPRPARAWSSARSTPGRCHAAWGPLRVGGTGSGWSTRWASCSRPGRCAGARRGARAGPARAPSAPRTRRGDDLALAALARHHAAASRRCRAAPGA